MGMHKSASRYRRLWPLILLAIVTALAGCSSVGEDSLEKKIAKYEASLRTEADWLWNNMNYVRTYAVPDAEYCADERFNHKPVEMSVSARQKDRTAAGMVDHLDYAADRIKEARDQWELFCQGKASAQNTAVYIESRLLPTYESLNTVRLKLQPTQPTPKPGSG